MCSCPHAAVLSSPLVTRNATCTLGSTSRIASRNSSRASSDGLRKSGAWSVGFTGIRSTFTFCATSTIGDTNAASLRASSGESLTPAMSVAASMSVRCRAGRGFNASSNPARSSSTVYFADGTNCFRNASSAACTDQASMPSASDNSRKQSGDGPTVLIVILDRAMRNFSPSINDVAASLTLMALRPASPMPMNTIFVNGGILVDCAATRLAMTNCARISSGVRLRTRPILAVAQNLHPWSQPT
mmetsp:Transcript_26473/g.80302  ORF Transcript_26473/g.80302 Transcript_26473/m.80302 type:complete len:244 (+) Transcript_26473:1186-1917(+)